MLEFIVFVLSVLAIVQMAKTRSLNRRFREMSKDLKSLRESHEDLISTLMTGGVKERKRAPETPPAPIPQALPVPEPSLSRPAPFKVEEKPLSPPKVEAPAAAASVPKAVPTAPSAPASAPLIPTPPQPPKTPPPPPPPPRPPRKRIEWERWIGVRGAALLGGIVFAIAAFLFFQYSVEKGFIKFTPLVRVVMGTVGGLLLLFLGEFTRKRKYAFVPNALAGAGIVCLYATFWAAKILYNLIGFEITFLLMVLVTVAGGLLSIRQNSLFVAVLGLVGGFVTPLILSSGKDNPIGLFSYVLLLDLGFLWVAQKQKWSLVSFLALIGTFILEAAWIFARMGPDRLLLGMGILVVFAVLFAWMGSRASKKGMTSGFTQQAFGILIPFLFALYFAGNAKLSQHLYPLAGMMLIMSLMAIFVARSRNTVFLVTAAATATMTVIGVWWAPYPITLALAWEMLGVIALFTVLFCLAPRTVPLQKRGGWYVPAFVALLGASLFSVFLAGSKVWSAHFYPLFLLLILLEALVIFIPDEKILKGIHFISVGRSLFVALVWFSSQFILKTGVSENLLWESIALFSALALWNHLQSERDPENTKLSGPMLPVLAMVGGYLFLWIFVGGLQMPPLWPYFTGWLFLSALALRQSCFRGRQWFSLPAAVLLGLGLGVSLIQVAQSTATGLPSLSLYRWIPLFVAIAWQFWAVFRKDKPDHHFAENSAGALPLIQLIFLFGAPSHPALSFPYFQLLSFGFAFLLVLVATRLGDGLWYLLGMVILAALSTFGEEKGFVLQRFIAQIGMVLFFTYWPFLFAKRFHQDRWIWVGSALAGALWFFSLKRLYLLQFGDGAIGILPVFLGFVTFTAAGRVRKLWTEQEPSRKRHLVWFLAVALSFVSVAIPLQLSKEWITIGWAIEGFLLLLLWKRLDHAGLKYFSLALLMTVTARLIFNSEVLLYHERSGMRILNWLLYTYWVPSICLIGAAMTLSPLEKERARPWEKWLYAKNWPLAAIASGISAIAVIFVWINLAIADWFSTSSVLSLHFERHQARDLATSISWGIYAIVLLGVGMYRKSQGLRWVSLIFLVLTIGKVFLYDLGELKDLYRVISLVGLAFSLIIVSLAYQRFVFRKTTEAK